MLKDDDCKECALCDEPRVESQLLPDSDILFVGQSPSEEDIRAGYHFCHRSLGGTTLRNYTDELKVRYSITYLVKCCTGDGKVRKKEIDRCAPKLKADIEFTKPKLIVALGRPALIAVTGKNLGITKMNGKVIYEGDIPVLACISPSSVRHDGSNISVFEKGILPAIKFFVAETSLEWCIKDTILPTDEDVGFDIETSALRPHNGVLKCFAVSDGDNAIFVEIDDE